VAIWAVSSVVGEWRRTSRAERPIDHQMPRQTPGVPPSTSRESAPFRPRETSDRPRTPVRFRDGVSAESRLRDLDLTDLVDALTGIPLNKLTPLYRCRCQVYYQLASFEVIRQENGGRCVACAGGRPVIVESPGAEWGRNADTSVVTMRNYRDHVDRVVSFEGRVVKVISSRRGTDFAAMFEDRDWSKGFKIVAFERDLHAVGGGTFMRSLANRTVRVRGLLKHHPIFGHQIIISDRSMILSVA
jgi:hypothetical protein